MKQLLAITLFALMLAGGTRAQTVTPDAPAAAAAPSQKVICVRGLADTGSHLGASKVCHTENEWTMIRNQSERTMERYDTLQNREVSPERNGR
jgi:hypothetical protein